MIHPTSVALIISTPQQILSQYRGISGGGGRDGNQGELRELWEQTGTGHRDRGCRGLRETGQAA